MHLSFLKTYLYYFPLFHKSCRIHQSQFTILFYLCCYLGTTLQGKQPWKQILYYTSNNSVIVYRRHLLLLAIARKNPSLSELWHLHFSVFLTQSSTVSSQKNKNSHWNSCKCVLSYQVFVLGVLVSPLRKQPVYILKFYLPMKLLLQVIVQNSWSFKEIFHQVKTAFPWCIETSRCLSVMLKLPCSPSLMKTL